MAFSWLGSAVTGKIAGDSQDFMALAVLHNDRFSGHNVYVRRAALQLDMTGVATTTTPFVPLLTYRGTGSPSVGDVACTTPKCSFDTTQTSDPLVRLYYPATGDGINDSQLIGTPAGGAAWRQWNSKLITGAEQYLGSDSNMLPMLVRSSDFVLKPNQYLIFRADPITPANNNCGLGWFVSLVWQEEPLNTHTIGGTVKLSGVGVIGAKVVVLVSDDTSMSNATILGTYTTTTGGAWTSDPIPDGIYAYAYAQQDAGGGTLYSATGAPYIS